MPRTKPRFNDLKDRMIRTMEAGADPKTSADAELAKFSQWYLNPAGRTPRSADSKRKTEGLVSIALYSFSIPASADTIFATTMSKRSATWAKTTTAVLTASNIIKTPADVAKGKAIKNFYPAQAIYRETTSDAPEKISEITGRRYTPKSAASDKGYVVPFGTTATGDKTVSVVQKELDTAKPAGMIVSFKPEEYNGPADVFTWT